MDRELTAHAAKNRDAWKRSSDEYQAAHAAQLAEHGAAWVMWQIPEDELRVLGDVAGRDVLELGCGAAQWSIALAIGGVFERRAFGPGCSGTSRARADRGVLRAEYAAE